MGIREYFKQHPEEEDLKMQNFKIEAEKSKDFKERLKDILGDFTWEQFRDVLEKMATEYSKEGMSSDLFRGINPIRDFNILFPDEKDEVEKRTHDYYYRVLTYLDFSFRSTFDEKTFWPFHVFQAKDLKLAFSAKEYEAFKFNSELGWLKAKFELEYNIGDKNWVQALSDLLNMKILFYDKFRDFEIKSYVISNIKADLIEVLRKREYGMYIFGMARLRLVLPEEAEQMKIDWEGIYKYIENENLDIEHGSNMLAMLKILLADEARITENGRIELKFHEKKFEKIEKTKRPERKQF